MNKQVFVFGKGVIEYLAQVGSGVRMIALAFCFLPTLRHSRREVYRQMNTLGYVSREKLGSSLVEVGDDAVHQQQERDAGQETAYGGNDPCGFRVCPAHLHGGDEQRPYGGGHHDSRSEAQQDFLYQGRYLPFHQEHAGCT